jgi:hypothetical protein
MAAPHMHSGLLQASQEHVIFCFDVLAGHFSGAGAPRPCFEDVHWCAATPVPLWLSGECPAAG